MQFSAYTNPPLYLHTSIGHPVASETGERNSSAHAARVEPYTSGLSGCLEMDRAERESRSRETALSKTDVMILRLHLAHNASSAP